MVQRHRRLARWEPWPGGESAGGRGVARVDRRGRSLRASPARAPGSSPSGRAHPAVEDAIARSRGAGRPLEPAARTQLGEGLGDSLDDVRVHDDPSADALARSVSARAFTTGSDIYFADGEYAPGSSEGSRLLAHEATHVVQQRGSPASGPLQVSDPGDASRSTPSRPRPASPADVPRHLRKQLSMSALTRSALRGVLKGDAPHSPPVGRLRTGRGAPGRARRARSSGRRCRCRAPKPGNPDRL